MNAFTVSFALVSIALVSACVAFVLYERWKAKRRTLTWRPGGEPGKGVAADWAEVQAFIAKTDGAVTVLIDDSFAPAVVPRDSGMMDCRRRVSFVGSKRERRRDG